MECKSIAVLLKVVPDPDGVFRAEGDGVTGAHLPQIPSVFDENAVEAAVQIKEATGAKVTVLSLGGPDCEPHLKRMLAMGADDVILVEQSGALWDSEQAAAVLAATLREVGGFDLVLCGREAADTGSGLVGPWVAQSLGMPFLTLASRIAITDEGLEVERPCEGGYDRYLCRLPLLLTVAGEANRPRMPSVMKMMQAKKLPVQKLAPGAASAETVQATRALPVLAGNCTLFAGEGAARDLVRALRQERML